MLTGRLTDLRPNTKVEIQKNDALIEPIPDMYYRGHIELKTTAERIPSIGFHSINKSACTLYERNGDLYHLSSVGTGGKIVTTQEETIPITYLNGFKQIWGGTVCIRTGNEVTLYLEINSSEATDKSLPIAIVKYTPITPINVMCQSDNSIGNVAIVIDPSNKEVRIQPWSQPIIGTNTIATLKYITREAFR